MRIKKKNNYTTKQAAKYLWISILTVRKAIRDGKLKATKIKNSLGYRIRGREILRFADVKKNEKLSKRHGNCRFH